MSEEKTEKFLMKNVSKITNLVDTSKYTLIPPNFRKNVLEILRDVLEVGEAASAEPGCVRVSLIPAQIERNVKLLDGSVIEAKYVVRKLRAAIFYGTEHVSLKHNEETGQVYSKIFKIWFGKNEFVFVGNK